MWLIVLDIMVAKQHLTLEGLLRIIAIKSHFPLGLSSMLASTFPSLPSFVKPSFIPFPDPLDSSWIAGFVNGDGSFTLGFRKRSNLRFSATCILVFSVGQQERDQFLLERIVV